MSFIKEFLQNNLKNLLGDEAASTDLAKVLSRPHSKSSISFLLFVNDTEDPQYLLKVNRDPDYKEAIVSEYNNFKNIYDTLKSARDSVPKPVFLKELENGHSIFCQTAVKGKKLGYEIFEKENHASKHDTIRKFINMSFDWLARFHSETNSGSLPVNQEFIKKYCLDPAGRFHSGLKDEKEAETKNKLNCMTEFLSSYKGEKIPLSSVHGDYDYSNILFDGSKVGVVDWEDSAAQGLPFKDIFFFITQLGLNFYPRLIPIESFKKFIKDGTWTRDLIDEGISSYSKKTLLKKELLYGLLPFFGLELLSFECAAHRDPKSYLFRSREMVNVLLDMNFDKTGTV